MPLPIPQDTFAALGYDLDKAIAAYQQALTSFASTEGMPAPIAAPLVEQIVKQYAGLYTIVPAPMPPPVDASAGVDLELARRIALGVTVTLSTGKTIPVQTRDDTDFRNINGLSTCGLALQGQGSTQTTVFRDANNQSWTLAPAELVEMGLKVLAGVQAIYAKSWALKAMSPIPADYATNDSYWT
jgi:hypothetical protein